MQRLEDSGAVRPLYESLGVKGLNDIQFVRGVFFYFVPERVRFIEHKDTIHRYLS